jgi:hypothetical protein
MAPIAALIAALIPAVTAGFARTVVGVVLLATLARGDVVSHPKIF